MADTRFNRAFVNDAQGNAVYVNQGAGQAGNLGGRIQNLPGGYVGGFIGDAANPGHIQRQLVVNGEVLARYGDAPNTEKLPTSSDEKPTYQNTAEFKLNAAPLKLKGANLDPVAYTIVGGETLKDIARNVLGDASLWWRIADANGLSVSGAGQLTPGQTLSVPKLALNSNNVETFQPYDPSQVTGSTDPLLPAPAGQGGRGCGGLGRIIMVVAVVASIYTAASGLAGPGGQAAPGGPELWRAADGQGHSRGVEDPSGGRGRQMGPSDPQVRRLRRLMFEPEPGSPTPGGRRCGCAQRDGRHATSLSAYSVILHSRRSSASASSVACTRSLRSTGSASSMKAFHRCR